MYDDELRILRKVRITEGMSNDGYLFVTDATNDELQEWANEVAVAMYDGDDSNFLDWLAKEHFLKLLYDSELEHSGKDLQDAIGWDIAIDLSVRPCAVDIVEKKAEKTWLRAISKLPKHVFRQVERIVKGY